MTGRGPIVSGIHILEQPYMAMENPPPDFCIKHLDFKLPDLFVSERCLTFLLVSSPFSMVIKLQFRCCFPPPKMFPVEHPQRAASAPGLSRHWSGRGSRGSDSRRWSGGFCLHGWHWFGPLAAKAKVLTHFGSENPVSSWLNSGWIHIQCGAPQWCLLVYKRH